MAELIDIYDTNMRYLGRAERSKVHREAHWHRTFHCWVVSRERGGSLLFQLRSRNTENFPGLFDVSAAGHLQAGEAIEDGLREASEELGVAIPPENVHFLGYRVSVLDRDDGYRDREFQAVHMVLVDQPLSAYNPQVSEVAGLAWLDLPAAIRLFSGASTQETGDGIIYEEPGGTWVPFQPALKAALFVPRLERYYLSACIMAERLLQDRFPLAV